MRYNAGEPQDGPMSDRTHSSISDNSSLQVQLIHCSNNCLDLTRSFLWYQSSLAQ